VIAGEEGSDKVVPPVSSEKKRKKRKGEEEGCGSARWLLGWSFSGRPSSCPFPFFFCSETFSDFCFVICLNFYILAPNELKPISKFF
jgi:hypothetical protein